ncbi:hypothetical protein OOT46_29165 [Aquabacterium sp. A7-Y]|uniref:hypothetical protein n=1 Tax=Aquabacterium sp. A7-Y TaxID=1349605 RepID=UPI00223DD8C0|nr:hypothetical protein [Aquabacterium sp. A7-Y]MCW7541872.1 hypothetical protein [Aquabacterium sp. A7-Y]
MKTYVLLIATAAVAAAIAGTFFYGESVGQARCEAAQARDEHVARIAADAANKAAAAAIGKIEIQHVTVRQTIEREVRTVPVYRDCRHSPDGLRVVNEALTGRAEPARGGELPAAAAPQR